MKPPPDKVKPPPGSHRLPLAPEAFELLSPQHGQSVTHSGRADFRSARIRRSTVVFTPLRLIDLDRRDALLMAGKRFSPVNIGLIEGNLLPPQQCIDRDFSRDVTAQTVTVHGLPCVKVVHSSFRVPSCI